VAVVRALINQPKLLLADEPTGALDRASAQGLGDLLVQLNREDGVTLIVVTHALDLAKRMGRVLELRDGRLTRMEDERRTETARPNPQSAIRNPQ
jgi:ABC-type lipoprotein export system ATPase subunit